MATDLDLRVQFTVHEGERLEVDASVVNRASSRVFVLNGLWNLDSSSRFVREVVGAYRFLDADRLVLLVGIPWLPYSRTPVYQNVPHATALAPGDSLDLGFSVSLPVKEYNPYFPEQEDASYDAVTASAVKLALHYVVDRPEFEVRPSAILDGYHELPPEALGHVATLESDARPTSVEALRRTDEEFERPTEGISVEG